MVVYSMVGWLVGRLVGGNEFATGGWWLTAGSWQLSRLRLSADLVISKYNIGPEFGICGQYTCNPVYQ